MSNVYGIDVSHHQGAINWQKVASELRRVNNDKNPGFAILRVGYSNRSGKGGLILDSQFNANMAGCEKYGVPFGIYWYCYDQSVNAARITAQQVLAKVKGHKMAYPAYYDVEYEPFNLSCGKAMNTAMIQAALKVFEDANYYAAVYCSRSFFTTYTNLAGLSGFDKWEAAYTAADTSTVSNGMWQYGSKNNLGIAGFGNSLDCDVAYTDYPSIMSSKGLNGYVRSDESNNVDNSSLPVKSDLEVAQDVLAGVWGTGAERKNKLTQAGYDYATIQKLVNSMVVAQVVKKSTTEIAQEVIAGKWGSGQDRKNKLQAAGYNYAEVQKEVNKLMTIG